MELVGLYFYSYLIGSVPTAYIIARWVKGIDIRQYGSGTVGGTNLFRQAGWRWPLPLGIFEIFAKGASPVWIGLYLLDLERGSIALVVAPLLAVAGHNWSVFLKFSGGRGIVTAGGAMLALPTAPPWELVLFVLIAISGWAIFRASAPSVLVSLLLLPIWSWLLNEPAALNAFFGCLIVLVAFKRLLANWDPLPTAIPMHRVLINRLLKDRDTDKQEDWVGRLPDNEDQTTD